MTGSICVESVFLGLKSCSGTRPCVNFSTPPKRAKKAVPPPPSPPPLVRAPGGWYSPEDQAVSANDMLVISSELMQLRRGEESDFANYPHWYVVILMLNGGSSLLLSAVCHFIFAWFVLDCGLWFLLLRVLSCMFCSFFFFC